MQKATHWVAFLWMDAAGIALGAKIIFCCVNRASEQSLILTSEC
jgi:hypothetical protein